ncbi:MAG: hypothetical protein Q9192_006604 [Flavoplaca navasiana]
MPPTFSTDKHPPDNDSERPSPRRSQRIRKVEECATDLVSKYRPTPVPSKLRKRQREKSEPCTEVTPPQKRPRPTDGPKPSWNPQPTEQQAATSLGQSRTSHIAHWAQQGQVWPSEFFEVNKMLPRRRSIASLRRKRSDASLGTAVTPSDLTTNDAVYRHPNYAYIMEKEAGSFLKEYKEGATQASEALCQSLLDREQAIPPDTIFRDDTFARACQQFSGKNEARIFKDCTPLIVPGAESHALLSADRRLDVAIESVNEGWLCSNPITNTRPQPDYAVGFCRSAFSDDQLKKLGPYIADPFSTSHIMGTYYMVFPFLTCEVKSGGSATLDIADRQNLHSMTIALRGIVELFKLVSRVHEIHRRVLTFSVSHDHETVRIYGHYPVIEGDRATYWRYPIRKYDFTERRGLERWTAYKFTKNVYDIWMPKLFELILSAVDQLTPEMAAPLEARAAGADVSESTGPSQQVGQQGLVEVPESHIGPITQQVTPDTSTQMEQSASKKSKG